MSPELKNALIVTIGTEVSNNSNLFESLRRSIDPQVFTAAALIASPESLDGARKIAEALNWDEGAVSIETLTSAHDLDEVFRTVNDCIHRFTSSGYAVEQITVNYTSGTKVMSSGAVLSAIYNSCESLQYITGSGGNGRKQRSLYTRPRSIFAWRDLMRARRHLLDRQFNSAEEALKAIDGSLLSDHECSLISNMLNLVYAYRSWETNRTSDFLNHYDQVEFKFEQIEPFKLNTGQHEVIENLAIDFAKQRPTPLLSVEMRNSALRVLMSGDPDDSAERLYRSLEFLSQWKLETTYQISADNLEIRKVPPRYRPAFEVLRSMEDGKIRIGMRKSYELLALLGDPAGLDFAADARLQGMLKRRDFGLLAHGIEPISKSEAEAFISAATHFLRLQIKDFDQLCLALQFPWMIKANGYLACG